MGQDRLHGRMGGNTMENTKMISNLLQTREREYFEILRCLSISLLSLNSP